MFSKQFAEQNAPVIKAIIKNPRTSQHDKEFSKIHWFLWEKGRYNNTRPEKELA